MAEKANPKSQQGKGQPSPRRRTQEGTAHARPAHDPGHRPPSCAPAVASASVRSRRPATSPQPRVPCAQDTPGPSTATQGPRDPGDSTEPPQRRVRVARLTEAGLAQLGGISTYQRILEWLEGTFASRAEAMAELEQELEKELQEELQEYCDALENKDQEGGEDP